MYVSASFIHIDIFFPSSIWEMHPQWSQIRHVIDIPLTKITHRGLYIRSAIFTQPNVVDGLGLKRFVSFVFFLNNQLLILADIWALAMLSI